MANLHIDSESAQNNDEFLFSAAKRFMALEERINSLKSDQADLSDKISEQMWEIAQKAHKTEAYGYIGIVSKLAIGAELHHYEIQLNEPPLYDRIVAQSVMSARRIIQQHIAFASEAAEQIVQQVA